jgi:hypothetical protein
MEQRQLTDIERAGGPQPSNDQREDVRHKREVRAHKRIEEAQKNFIGENLVWAGWIKRTRWLPFVIILLGFLVIIRGAVLSGVALVYSSVELPPLVVGTLIGVLITLIGIIFLSFYKSRMAEARGYFEELESKTNYWESNPAERARLKIQFYMHENLRQVRWIFWLTLVAMFLGFLIIIIGAILALDPLAISSDTSSAETSSIVTTLSGVIVEFIAATFLWVYRSTMKQAREYVNVLLRLNIINMSIEQTDKIKDVDGDPTLRNKAIVRLASNMISQSGLEKEDESRRE